MKRTALLVFVLAPALAGCGSSSSTSAPSRASSTASSSTASSSSSSPSPSQSSSSTTSAPAPAGATVHVAMKDLAFKPGAVRAKVGDVVRWSNDDGPPHNVTYVSGPRFTSSSTIDPGGSFQIKLTQPGVIHYFCSIHPFMRATITVTK